MQKFIQHIVISLSLVITSSLQLIAQGTSPVGVNFIIVNFDQAPTTLSVIKAPLKYNKDFALSLQMDDTHKSIYEVCFPIFEGDATYPGFFYSDGCGNNHSFKMSSSIFIYSGNTENGLDNDILNPDNNYTNKLKWAQLDSLYQNNWGVLSHGINGNANTSSDFINYSIRRNKSYVRRNLYNATEGGLISHLFVNPNGSEPWTAPAFDLAYRGAYRVSNNSPIGNDGGNVNDATVAWPLPHELTRPFAGSNLTGLVDIMATNSVGDANFWCPTYTHGMGIDYQLSSFLSDFTYIANEYGIDGSDNILMTSDEEILDYLVVRDAVQLNYVLNGSMLMITFTGDVPNNLHFYSSSIVIESDANISSIIIDGTDDYTDTITNNTDALININWDGYYVIPAEILADSMTTIATTTQTQFNCWIAMDYVITMDNGPHKDSLRLVLCAIPNMVYDDGFCICETVLQPNETTINLGDSYTIEGPVGEYDYLWEDEIDSIGSSPNITVTPTDTSLYYLTTTNSYGCPSTDSILVNVHELNINIGPDTAICVNDCISISGPDNMVEYSWFVDDTLYQSSQTINPCPITATEYKLFVEDSFGATAVDSILVNVRPRPVIDIQPNDTTINETASIVLFGASGNYTYEWFIGNSLIATSKDITRSTTDTTMYLHVATDIYGCSGQDSIQVNIEFLAFNLGSDTAICEGNCVVFSGPDEMVEYIWYVADTIYSTEQVINPCPTTTTQYKLWVKNNLDATATDSLIVVVNQNPVFDLQPNDTTINENACIDLIGAVGNYTYEWFIDDVSISTSKDINRCPDDTTLYNLVATDIYGCIGEDSIQVNVQFLSFDLGPDTAICYGNC